MSNDATMRLQKFLARAGVASRRKCEELIASGHIKVNGKIVCEMGTTVNLSEDVIEYDGTRCVLPHEDMTLMLNKPKGYLTAMSDSRAHTVAELIPTDQYPGIFPIGRLDKDTTGLLLFTTDGELGYRLAHPKHHVDKRYVALIEGPLSERDVNALEAGIELEDGLTAPAKCEVIAYDPHVDATRAALTIHEGRKRQVRRMFASLGHEVIELERTDFGGLSIGDLPCGQWRELTDDEVASLSRFD